MSTTSQQEDPPIIQNPLAPQIQSSEITESTSTSSMESSGGTPEEGNHELIQIPRQIASPPITQTAHQRAIPLRLGPQFERYHPQSQAHGTPSGAVAAQKPSLFPFSVTYYLSGVIISSITALLGAVLMSFAPWNRKKRRPKTLKGGKMYKVSQKVSRRHERDWLVKDATF